MGVGESVKLFAEVCISICKEARVGAAMDTKYHIIVGTAVGIWPRATVYLSAGWSACGDRDSGTSDGASPAVGAGSDVNAGGNVNANVLGCNDTLSRMARPLVEA